MADFIHFRKAVVPPNYTYTLNIPNSKSILFNNVFMLNSGVKENVEITCQYGNINKVMGDNVPISQNLTLYSEFYNVNTLVFNNPFDKEVYVELSCSEVTMLGLPQRKIEFADALLDAGNSLKVMVVNPKNRPLYTWEVEEAPMVKLTDKIRSLIYAQGWGGGAKFGFNPQVDYYTSPNFGLSQSSNWIVFEDILYRKHSGSFKNLTSANFKPSISLAFCPKGLIGINTAYNLEMVLESQSTFSPGLYGNILVEIEINKESLIHNLGNPQIAKEKMTLRSKDSYIQGNKLIVKFDSVEESTLMYPIPTEEDFNFKDFPIFTFADGLTINAYNYDPNTSGFSTTPITCTLKEFNVNDFRCVPIVGTIFNGG